MEIFTARISLEIIIVISTPSEKDDKSFYFLFTAPQYITLLEEREKNRCDKRTEIE